jgi:hypothetical protein
VIGKDGFVKDALVVRSSGKEFEEPVIAATKRWRFHEMGENPAKQSKGMIVECSLRFSCD